MRGSTLTFCGESAAMTTSVGSLIATDTVMGAASGMNMAPIEAKLMAFSHWGARHALLEFSMEEPIPNLPRAGACRCDVELFVITNLRIFAH